MENVVLIVHLLLALALIAVVLLQRSEGGGLGMGGGSVATGRAPATPLGKVTWGLAIAFIATSITLTIMAATRTENASVVDRIRDVPQRQAPADPALPAGEDLLPPGPVGDAPLVPRAAE
jgi:preprotein translocase subunit SecG